MGCSDSKSTGTTSGSKPASSNPSTGKSGSKKLLLYAHAISNPSRAVFTVLKMAKIDFDVYWLDLVKGEHKEEWFKKINPDCCVPTIVDGDFTLWESRAVMPYLLGKYAAGHALYPTDLQQRALVNRQLHYELGTFFPAFFAYFFPYAFEGKPPDTEKEAKMIESLDYLNGCLEGKRYFAGDAMTIADISFAQNLVQLMLVDYDLSKWPNLVRLRDEVKCIGEAEEIIKKFDETREQMLCKAKEQKQAEE